MKHYLFATVISLSLMCLFWSTAQADGPVSDQILAELRTGKSGIKNSKGYAVQILTGRNLPQLADPSYTAGWIGIELKPRIGSECGGLYSCEFSQVGIYETQYGRTWFVYAEPGVQCYRGHPIWIIDGITRGCMGDIGDLVKPNKWHKFDLQTYDTTPYWLAHVYDKDGNMYYVAKILTNNRTVVPLVLYFDNLLAQERSDLTQVAFFFHSIDLLPFPSNGV